MFKYGWVRLWVVLTGALLAGVTIVSSYYVWGTDACYKFVSVTVADNTEQKGRQLAGDIKSEATTKTFCGKIQYSVLVTLEDLAQRGVVTQVGIQWLEPSGWSFNDHDMLDVLDGGDIKASEIINRVSSYVHKARFFSTIWFFVVAILVSAFALALGYGIAWIRRGFSKRDS